MSKFQICLPKAGMRYTWTNARLSQIFSLRSLFSDHIIDTVGEALPEVIQFNHDIEIQFCGDFSLKYEIIWKFVFIQMGGE